VCAVLGFTFALYAGSPAAAQVTGQPPATPAASPKANPSSSQFIAQDGLPVERLVELAGTRRADLLAARQRLAIAQGQLAQGRLRPNPELDVEYGTPRFLGGEPESDFSAGISQTFELGGKRRRRVAVAELNLQQVRFEVAALERRVAAEIRTAYTRAVAAARQLDVTERLLGADNELVRATEARLREGDVAPLDSNLVKVENDRLRIQQIDARSELEMALLEIRGLVGLDVADPIRLAPQSERPPRLDLALSDLTATALRERADLQAAVIGERLGTARIDLARSQAVPDVAASVRYSRSKGLVDLPENLGGGDLTDTDSELTFGVSIGLPVFNRNQGEIASAVGEREQARRQREFLEATIKRDVAVAYRQYRAAAEKLVLYATQILPRAEANLQTVRTAYGAGEFSVFEVVNEQRRLNEAVTGYNQTLRDYYNALAQLETALGIPLPPTAFATGSTSVLPAKDLVPQQVDKEKLLKSLFENNAGPVGSGKLTGPNNKQEKE
jgi:cobalt-zinc-cadmium efflux system outer membrane protein